MALLAIGLVPFVAVFGRLERAAGTATSVAIVQECVAHEGDAWSFTLDAVDQYFERILVIPKGETTAPTLLNLVVGWPQILEEKR